MPPGGLSHAGPHPRVAEGQLPQLSRPLTLVLGQCHWSGGCTKDWNPGAGSRTLCSTIPLPPGGSGSPDSCSLSQIREGTVRLCGLEEQAGTQVFCWLWDGTAVWVRG